MKASFNFKKALGTYLILGLPHYVQVLGPEPSCSPSLPRSSLDSYQAGRDSPSFPSSKCTAVSPQERSRAADLAVMMMQLLW